MMFGMVRGSMNDDFVWEELPDNYAQRTLFEQLSIHFPKLRRKPNEWARVRVYATMSKATQNAHRMRIHEEWPDDIQVAARRLEDKTGGLYLRYVEN